MAGEAVPSGFMDGGGIAAERLGKGPFVLCDDPEDVIELVAARLRRRDGEASGVGVSNVMKNGVYSPSNGAMLPSEVFPRKYWSSWLGGSGFGVYSEELKDRMSSSRRPRNLAAETALP